MAVPEHVKQPTDHQAPATEAFVYTSPSGGRVTLPPFSKAFTFGFMRKNRHKGEMELTFEIVEKHCDDAELAILDELDLADFQKFQQQWQDHGGVSMGESSAS